MSPPPILSIDKMSTQFGMSEEHSHCAMVHDSRLNFHRGHIPTELTIYSDTLVEEGHCGTGPQAPPIVSIDQMPIQFGMREELSHREQGGRPPQQRDHQAGRPPHERT